MRHDLTRRRFLKTTAATGIGYWVAAGTSTRAAQSANDRIAVASIGVSGKGSSDTANAAQHGDIVALCDVDEKRLGSAAKRYDSAKTFVDFRKMLDEMGDRIDAVTVSTPDHTHAPAALMAMRMGKHAFVQKPMSHSIYEARLMGEVARQAGVATQMGNQTTAVDGLRRSAALVRAGLLGPIREVHVWTNRPIWPQGGPVPEPKEVPEELDWDCWIGPAEMRPYAPGYHPFSWRGWWDFGTGALGDMGCHAMNMPHMALNLKDPVAVTAESPGHNGESYPKWSIITYEYPEMDGRPEFDMIWYDGGKRPPRELFAEFPSEDGKGITPAHTGAILIGEKGMLYYPHSMSGEAHWLGVEPSDVEFDQSPGHVTEWFEAMRGGPAAKSNFPDYATPLTETVLLGNLAVWATGKRVEWDAVNLRSPNTEGLEEIIKPVYREGYTLDA